MTLVNPQPITNQLQLRQKKTQSCIDKGCQTTIDEFLELKN